MLELRLAGASTREQANAFLQDYLSRFNAQFALPVAEAGTAYRPLPAGLKLEDLMCFKYERVVAADNMVQFGSQRIQLLAGRERCGYARATVQVHEHFDGSLSIHYAGHQLASTEAPLEAPQLCSRGGRLCLFPPASVAEPQAAETKSVKRQTPRSTMRPQHPCRK